MPGQISPQVHRLPLHYLNPLRGRTEEVTTLSPHGPCCGLTGCCQQDKTAGPPALRQTIVRTCADLPAAMCPDQTHVQRHSQSPHHSSVPQATHAPLSSPCILSLFSGEFVLHSYSTHKIPANLNGFPWYRNVREKRRDCVWDTQCEVASAGTAERPPPSSLS